MEFAGFLHDGVRTADEIADMLEKLCAEYGHRDPRGRRELDDIAEWVIKRAPFEPCLPDDHPLIVENSKLSIGMTVFRNAEARAKWIAENIDVLDIKQKPTEEAPEKAEFKFPKVPGKVSDYMLLPQQSPFDGWCGRGRTHIIAGSSGSGKTTLMLPLLHDQWRGKTVFGHIGASLQPLIIFADRGEFSNEETLLRLGLTTSSLPIRYLSDAIDDSAIDEILRLIEEQSPFPEVVFVEGADELVSKASDSAIVSRFMNGIRKISVHYHIAFVLSVGAPKSKPKDQHALVRDRVFGSEKWARKSDMIMSLAAAGDGTGKNVQLVVQHRNAAPEKFDLEFADGKLIQKELLADDLDALEAWMCGQDWFTRNDAVAALKEYAGMSKPSVNRRIYQMLKTKKLETRPSQDRKVEELRLKREPQSAEQREMDAAMESIF